MPSNKNLEIAAQLWCAHSQEEMNSEFAADIARALDDAEQRNVMDPLPGMDINAPCCDRCESMGVPLIYRPHHRGPGLPNPKSDVQLLCEMCIYGAPVNPNDDTSSRIQIARMLNVMVRRFGSTNPSSVYTMESISLLDPPSRST